MRHGSPDFHADPLGLFLGGAATRATILLVESFRRFASGLQRLSVEEASGRRTWNVGGNTPGGWGGIPRFFWNFHPEPLGKFDPIWRTRIFFFRWVGNSTINWSRGVLSEDIHRITRCIHASNQWTWGLHPRSADPAVKKPEKISTRWGDTTLGILFSRPFSCTWDQKFNTSPPENGWLEDDFLGGTSWGWVNFQGPWDNFRVV